jgi:predicted RNA binding protein YcfA (HicA-like mRNA interferase family)
MSAPLPVVTPQQVIRALRKDGYVLDHQTGSHVYLRHPSKPGLVTVPFHRRDLKRGTLKSILHQAKLSVDEFLKLV